MDWVKKIRRRETERRAVGSRGKGKTRVGVKWEGVADGIQREGLMEGFRGKADGWQHISIRVMIQNRGRDEGCGKRKRNPRASSTGLLIEMLYKGKKRKTKGSKSAHSFHIHTDGFQWLSGGKSAPLGLHNQTCFFYRSCARMCTWPHLKLQK